MNTGAPIDWKASYLALVVRLLGARESQGITQDHLARRLRVGRRSLQRWEAGEVEPKAMRLFQWAAELGIKIAPEMAPGCAA